VQVPVTRRFAELNQFRVGAAGLVACALLVTLAVNVGTVHTWLLGRTHTAQFTEAGGLKEGDDVQVAGLAVGTVTGVTLRGELVEVAFAVDGVRLGREARAAIKTSNAFGKKYLAVDPAGRGDLDGPIPVARTTSPYSLEEALSGFTRTTARIDAEQLARSFDVLSGTFANTPDEVAAALDGVGRLSATVARRDSALRELLARANSVTGVLSERNAEITRLLVDGDTLLAEVNARREVIHELLANVVAVSRELSGFAADNRTTLRPALAELERVTAVLKENERNLDTVVGQLGRYSRVLSESIASGPFFQALLVNLAPTNLAPGIAPTNLAPGVAR
jgi:phospholipid/cholesterol/gamma-HCH transport system substrate-binding protein